MQKIGLRFFYHIFYHKNSIFFRKGIAFLKKVCYNIYVEFQTEA